MTGVGRIGHNRRSRADLEVFRYNGSLLANAGRRQFVDGMVLARGSRLQFALLDRGCSISLWLTAMLVFLDASWYISLLPRFRHLLVVSVRCSRVR